MTQPLTIVWFRQDLRLADNPALRSATERGAVLPVYIWSPGEEGDWPLGGASKWWLHRSLESLTNDLARRHAKLILRQGASLDTLQSLSEETGADTVYWNRRYEPAMVERDKQIKQTLRDAGIEAKSFNGSLLYEPWEIKNKQGEPYQVFTPFWKACLAHRKDHDPLPEPDRVSSPDEWPDSDELADLDLQPRIPWDEGMREFWEVGAAAAEKQLRSFVKQAAADYKDQRNALADDGTSRLSPYLHFGEISPRQVWAEAQAAIAADKEASTGVETFLSEIGWREFGYQLLYHFPKTTNQSLREPFRDFPWRKNQKRLRRWQRGQTGYPVVDAAMRQLWHTGWMHNRARMIVASFLTKHLLLAWQSGAEWFWDTLVDADLASNTLGWQWSAGCGADAAPYFRIFNPMTQGEKFDPEGDYVRRWVPELAKLPAKWIYRPWEAPSEVLAEAGVKIGENYPEPMVEHSKARQSALDAYEKIRT